MNKLALLSCLLCLGTEATAAADPCLPVPASPARQASRPQAPDSPMAEDIAAIQAAIVAGVDPSMHLVATSAGPPYERHPYLTGGHFGAEPGSEDCE